MKLKRYLLEKKQLEFSVFLLAMTSALQGDSFKIYKPRARLQVRQKFFSHRVNEWNNSPQYIIEVKSVSSFKVRLDRHLKDIAMY